MGKLVRLLIAIWLLSLPILTAARLPIWKSDHALWSAALAQRPVPRRAWANLGRWDRVILIDEQMQTARQPFTLWRTKPVPWRRMESPR